MYTAPVGHTSRQNHIRIETAHLEVNTTPGGQNPRQTYPLKDNFHMGKSPESLPSECTCMGIHFQADIASSALSASIEYVEDLGNGIYGRTLMKFNREFSVPVRWYLPEADVKLTPGTRLTIHFTVPLIN
jgi:hypothetical protein